MFRHNPNLKNVKFETTAEFFARGGEVITNFLSKREMKAKKKLDLSEGTKYDSSQDAFNADTYRQMQLIGFIGVR